MRTETVENFGNRGLDEHGSNTRNREVGSNVRRSIAEDYINGRLDIHTHVEFATEKYCALLNRDIEVIPLGDTTSKMSDTEYASEGASGEQQVSMLIRIIQDVQIPEPLPVVVFPRTIARLKLVDDTDYCVRHPFEFTSLFSLVADGVIEDGEFVPFSGSIPLRQDELPDEMVEGTSEVVKHLTDDDIDSVGHGRHILEAADLLSRVIIDITDKGIGFEILDGRQVPAKRLYVLAGPVILNPRPFKRSYDKTLQKTDSRDATRPRNPRANTGRIRDEFGQGGEAGAGITDSPLEEGLTRTSPFSPHGVSTARHIHSGSLEDA